MYSVLATLFLIGVFLVAGGFLGRAGTDGISDVGANVAAALGLLVTYSFLILSLGSFSELAAFFEGICGGIPFLNEIADYGSLQKVLTESPLDAAVAFMDTVILSAAIEIVMLLPLTQGSATGKFMVKVFTGIVAAIVSLLLLNYVVKGSGVYQWIVAVAGSTVALLSVGTVPLLLIALFKKNSTAGIGRIAFLFFFSRSKIVGVLRSAFLKAIVYVCGIWMLEKHFGSIAGGLSQLSAVLVVFGPVAVVIIGLVLILKSVKL